MTDVELKIFYIDKKNKTALARKCLLMPYSTISTVRMHFHGPSGLGVFEADFRHSEDGIEYTFAGNSSLYGSMSLV